MADLSGFSSETFTTAAWINEAIKDLAEDESLESYLASLAMKLHIVSQDYTDQLETGFLRIIYSSPLLINFDFRNGGSHDYYTEGIIRY